VGRVVAVACLLVVAACSERGGSAAPAPHRATPTYPVVPRAVRLGERPVTVAPVQDGQLRFTLIAVRSGIQYMFGSHAEFDPKGEFARIRVIVENVDRSHHELDTSNQLLVTGTGKTYAPREEAMLIARQPTQIEVGANNRLEFDIWYDVPVHSTLQGVRFFGDPASAQGVTVPIPR
jgi:hypothetical protein